MATRSVIGILNADGSIDAHYCHSDGYFSWNGRILHHHYQDRREIRQLIDLGMQSVLGPEIGKKHEWDWETKIRRREGDWGKAQVEIDADPRANYSKFFGRDRGKTDVEPRRYAGLAELEPDFQEYLYLWDDAAAYWIGARTNVDWDDLVWHKLSDLAATDWQDLDERNELIVPTIPFDRAERLIDFTATPREKRGMERNPEYNLF